MTFRLVPQSHSHCLQEAVFLAKKKKSSIFIARVQYKEKGEKIPMLRFSTSKLGFNVDSVSNTESQVVGFMETQIGGPKGSTV